MANTRNRSRQASSDWPKPNTDEQKNGREAGSIKVEHPPQDHSSRRGSSASLVRNTPQVKLEPTSDSDSGEESEVIGESGEREEEVQVKVEVVSDTDTDTDSSGEAKDQVPELDHVPALRLAKVPKSRSARASSVLSIDDAKSTIESFFSKPETFTSEKKNKLKFWQSLCIEFGLVDTDANADSESDLSTVDEQDEHEDEDSDSESSGSSIQSLPPLPTSLNQANRLLKAKAHVNLQDYFAAREAEKQKMKAHRKSQRNRRKKGKKEKEMERTDLSHLVHPSSRAMIKYTIKHRKFVKVDRAKEAWLQPLLRSFHHRR